MGKYKVLSPVIYGGVIVADGEIELDEKNGSLLVEREVLEELESDNSQEDDETDIHQMKVPQLKDYAAKNGIDLGEATKKEDILMVIVEAEANANAGTTTQS